MPLRVGFIGCGARGSVMAQCYQGVGNVELVAACDLDEKRLSTFCERFNIPKGYHDWSQMLREENLDIVHLATHPDLRKEPICAAAEAKVKVIVSEKPIALSLPDLDEMMQACQTNNCKLVINHQLRYQTVWKRLQSAIENREIGDVSFFHAHCRMNALEQGTHLIDLVLWLHGNQTPTWVLGDAWGYEDFNKSHSAPNSVVGYLHFADGVRCLVHMGPHAPALPDSDALHTHFGIRVVGTEGWSQVWLGRWQMVKSSRQQSNFIIPYEPDDMEAQTAFQRDVVRAAVEPDFIHPCDARWGRASLEIIEALCLSTLEGRRLNLPLPKGISALKVMRKGR
ncbi:MAG: Gfo/Idh/MocA family oxidoreductase [Armatimonadota bacterium]|nr:Gfo/Idh/MocA family oxidoreductase [Armatimonadota bacterium]MDW8025695.1 Gfo/Idh/MocA family oxidoreductase [Armatimonadota bacterium]MDW8143149.1 Gfo/Idh/MocA family oxidoreductase [Armatimonadota bacterium]